MTPVEKEFQKFIHNFVDGMDHSPKLVKRTIKISRSCAFQQEWEIKIFIPDDKELQNEILDALNCEGLDWGKPSDERTMYCDDEMTIEE